MKRAILTFAGTLFISITALYAQIDPSPDVPSNPSSRPAGTLGVSPSKSYGTPSSPRGIQTPSPQPYGTISSPSTQPSGVQTPQVQPHGTVQSPTPATETPSPSTTPPTTTPVTPSTNRPGERQSTPLDPDPAGIVPTPTDSATPTGRPYKP